MADVYYAPESEQLSISFSDAPVHNVINTICLLNQDHMGRISDWVDTTRAALTEDETAQAKIACRVPFLLSRFMPQTVDELISAIRNAPPELIVRYQMEHIARKASLYGLADVPTANDLATSEQTFLALVRRFYELDEMELDEEAEREEYRLMLSPEFGKKMADAVEYFWTRYVKAEWPNVAPRIRESVAAFTSTTIPSGTLEERLKFVTGRDSIPSPMLRSIGHARELVYIPSVHIGPYMKLFDFDGTTVYLVGRARIPEGAAIHSAALDRSELLMRLEAISDSVRLSIIEQAAAGHVTTSSVMESLQLSQSSASRHLNQLAATGILIVDASERTKKFSVNNRRINELCRSLRELSSSSPGQEGE